MVLAAFRGKCPACGDWFGRGSQITRTETGWAHTECTERDEENEAALICLTCHLTIPCDCDDECDCEPCSAWWGRS